MSSNQLAQKAFRTHSLQKRFQIQVIFRNRAQTWVGTKMAHACTSIFMGTLESRILYERNPSPTHWKDDIFLVWTDTKESLEQFIKSINGLHPCINFTGDYFQQLKDVPTPMLIQRGEICQSLSPPIPNSVYMLQLPTLLGQAGVSCTPTNQKM